MKLLGFAALSFMFSAIAFSAKSQHDEDKEKAKVSASIEVLKDFTALKENIPSKLLKITEGFIIIPGLKNASLVVGGKRGKGIAVIKNADGSWSNPVFITLTGGSFGLQAGYQSVDLILVFKHRTTLENLDKGDFTLGGDISATAGPVGRSSTASTDYKLEAEVYSYSKSKGLFAGISLNGAALKVDAEANERYYAESASAKSIFNNDIKSDDEATAALKSTLHSLALRK
jgi:lipid-binding SYLF domain-containing protein